MLFLFFFFFTSGAKDSVCSSLLRFMLFQNTNCPTLLKTIQWQVENLKKVVFRVSFTNFLGPTQWSMVENMID